MSKTIFILGAGASFKAGVPLMGNFLDESRTLLSNGILNDNDRDHFERVFKGISALQSTHSKSNIDIYNLESVFATFEMAKRLKKMPSFEEDEIPILLTSMRRLIVLTIEKLLKYPVKGEIPQPPSPYDKLGILIKKFYTERVPNEEASIITFNYDTAADIMLHHINMGPDYCLENSMNFGDKTVKLLKLHGSINWGITKQHKRVRPLHIDEFLSLRQFFQNEVQLNFGSTIRDYKKIDFYDEPVIIPPTWNKATIHDDLLNVWTEAARELEQADNIIVIGFSLPETDMFFRHLYALGTVGDVPLNRFWVFDPDKSGTVKKRYLDLLGHGAVKRFKFFEETFENAIEILEEEFGIMNSNSMITYS